MSVNRGCIQSLHVVQCDWGIDKKSEYAGAEKIPEADRNKKVDWPFVCFNPLGWFADS